MHRVAIGFADLTGAHRKGRRGVKSTTRNARMEDARMAVVLDVNLGKGRAIVRRRARCVVPGPDPVIIFPAI